MSSKSSSAASTRLVPAQFPETTCQDSPMLAGALATLLRGGSGTVCQENRAKWIAMAVYTPLAVLTG